MAKKNQGPSDHDIYRANAAKAARGENYRAWEGGKGDIARNVGTKFQLGMDLLRVEQDHGKDSDEYQSALKAWKDAQ